MGIQGKGKYKGFKLDSSKAITSFMTDMSPEDVLAKKAFALLGMTILDDALDGRRSLEKCERLFNKWEEVMKSEEGVTVGDAVIFAGFLACIVFGESLAGAEQFKAFKKEQDETEKQIQSILKEGEQDGTKPKK